MYLINIENEVGTSQDEAKRIAEEISNKIFTPINDILVEKIKENGKVQNADAEQNLNFILSGGDYSAFLEPKEEIPEKNEAAVPVFSITDENLKKSSV